MSRINPVSILGGLLVGGLLAGGLTVLAAPLRLTPAVGTPMPAVACDVPSRTMARMPQMTATATSVAMAPTPSLSEVETHAGAPADPATIAAVTTTYQQLVACLNAGDYLRLYALYTDAYVIRIVQHGQLTQAQLQATPDPRRPPMTALVGLRDVRMLPDGRVAAQIETADPRAGRVVIDAILVRTGDRYQIDQERAVLGLAAATPA
jgi:hypothetical protein